MILGPATEEGLYTWRDSEQWRCQTATTGLRVIPGHYRAHQLYKNISMLFLFPVKDGKLSTGVNATFDASRYG